MDLLRQCVDALFQPIDLALNSFEPFALVDFSTVFDDVYSVRLNIFLLRNRLCHSGIRRERIYAREILCGYFERNWDMLLNPKRIMGSVMPKELKNEMLRGFGRYSD
jgi:hypothetical protein